MENKSAIKSAIKSISKVYFRSQRYLDIDLSMDGSGELGGVIIKSHYSFLKEKLMGILNTFGLSFEEVRKTCKEWALIELKYLPEYWIFSGCNTGCKTDFLDTKHGQLCFVLDDIYYDNDNDFE